MKYVLDCISDTHTMHARIEIPTPDLEPGDVWILLHAGDFTYHGMTQEVLSFTDWLQAQPHSHKVVIAGNHECFCDPVWVEARKRMLESKILDFNLRNDAYGASQAAIQLLACTVTPLAKLLKPHCTYLNGKSTTVAGLRIYGSPYSRRFRDWGFQSDPGDGRWDKIPKNTDVLLVHGPPKWLGDRCPAMSDRTKLVFVGDEELLHAMDRVRPAVTVFGHIHEGAGVYERDGMTAINASVLDGKYLHRGVFHRAVLDDKKRMISVTEVPYMPKITSGL